MTINDRDVSEEIRTDAVTDNVSAVSAHRSLREVMVELQREWAKAHPGCVAEGRDTGTVVFPNAIVKIFLTADRAERARRRAGETGGEADSVAAALERRDQFDSSRPISPLRPAEDALVVDTTDLGIDEVVAVILEKLPPQAL